MKSFKQVMMVISVLGSIVAQPVLADNALQSALDGRQRSEINKTRDAARHPKATLEFFGIAPGMSVVELAPGGGWYTEILAPYLQSGGLLTVGLPDANSDDAYARKSYTNFQKKIADNPALFGQVKTGVFEPAANKLTFAPPASVDMVLTFRNIHNWTEGGEARMKAIFNNVFVSLKSGGVFGVVEHRLPVNTVQDASTSTGYVSEAYVIKLAQDAGFRLDKKSEINANPKDHADHSGGVWALPPTYANNAVDRQKYAEIGESDRMTLRFVKP